MTELDYELADDEVEIDDTPINERRFLLSNGEVVLFLQSGNETDSSNFVGEAVSDGINTTAIIEELSD